MTSLAEFLAEVGFKVDKESLKSALAQVATFGAAVSTAAAGAIAGILRIAQSEAQLADDAQKLSVPAEKLEELRFVAEQTGVSTEALASSLEGLKNANPKIKDASVLLEKAGRAMRGMSDAAAKAYAAKLGIDPALIPMLRDDVSSLGKDFREMYAASGRNAARAAADGKALMQEFGRLKSLFELLTKSVAGAFIGKIRGSVELFRKTVMENFQKIKSVIEIIIGVVLRLGNTIAAFVYRVISFASGIIGWFDKLNATQKKVVVGIGLILAAWKGLNAGFLATPFGMLVAALTALFVLVDDYLTWAEGGKSYLDWSEHAATIEKMVAILKVLWKVVCSIGSGLAAAIEPAIGVFKTMFSTVGNIIGGIGDLIYNLFTGNLAGALDAAKGLWKSYSDGVIAIFYGLCDTIAAFFSGLWESVTASFPDFGAWASTAAASIKNIFGSALSWVKDKLRSLVSFMPDWVQKKLGMGEVAKDDAPPPMPATALRPLPTGPALIPSPLSAEGAVTKTSEVKVDSKTQITVNGAQNPEAVAGKVAQAQNHNAADIARHTQGAVR